MVLGSNPECALALLLDDTGLVMAATRRAFLGQPAHRATAMFDAGLAQRAARDRRAFVVGSADGRSLLAYTGVFARRTSVDLGPSRPGLIFIAYDLAPSQAEARAQILMPSRYRAALVGALALVLWLIFHFAPTRRVELLVMAAERLAAGDLGARARLSGHDELARLGGAFDAMAAKVGATQTLLRADIAKRERTEAALRVSEESYRAIFDAADDAIFVHEIPSGRFVDVNPRLRLHPRKSIIRRPARPRPRSAPRPNAAPASYGPSWRWPDSAHRNAVRASVSGSDSR
ncbi:MAG: HAMP domain-containing protein [Gammaproteobacteria bacterium]